MTKICLKLYGKLKKPQTNEDACAFFTHTHSWQPVKKFSDMI